MNKKACCTTRQTFLFALRICSPTFKVGGHKKERLDKVALIICFVQ